MMTNTQIAQIVPANPGTKRDGKTVIAWLVDAWAKTATNIKIETIPIFEPTEGK